MRKQFFCSIKGYKQKNGIVSRVKLLKNEDSYKFTREILKLKNLGILNGIKLIQL